MEPNTSAAMPMKAEYSTNNSMLDLPGFVFGLARDRHQAVELIGDVGNGEERPPNHYVPRHVLRPLLGRPIVVCARGHWSKRRQWAAHEFTTAIGAWAHSLPPALMLGRCKS